MKFFKSWTSVSLTASIAIGLPVGIALGFLLPSDSLGGQFVALIGTAFTGSLKSLAPVLVLFLVMSAVARAKSASNLKSVILLYLISTFTAACVAVIACYLFPIGLNLSGATAAENQTPISFGDMLSTLVTNLIYEPIGSLSNGNYLGILLWSVIMGFALHKASDSTKQLIHDFASALTLVVRWIVYFSPLGVMGIVYTSTSENGAQIFIDYGELILLLVLCMLFVAFVTNPLIVHIYTRKNPYPLVLRCIKESSLTAFFTGSSAANLPVNLALCEKLGLNQVKYSVCITLGATINMAGAAVTISVMSLQAAFTLGISVDVPTAILLCVLATIGACGASGVPGGSMLLVPVACGLFSIDTSTIELVLAIGAIISVIQDAFETALNSSSDVLFAAAAEYRDWTRAGREFKMGEDNVPLEVYAKEMLENPTDETVTLLASKE